MNRSRPAFSGAELWDGADRMLRVAAELSSALVTVALVLGLVMTPQLAGAQARADAPRIGMLNFGTAPSGTDPDPDKGIRQGLREHGYVEGQNIHIERRYADGRIDRVAALAAELVQMRVDVIFASGPAALEAARKATPSIPIVAMAGADPVREGWAQSLAHPGGNVTGMTVTFPELMPKCLELLQQAVPGLARTAVLIAPTDFPQAGPVIQAMQDGARLLRMQLQVLEVRGPQDFEAAFSLARAREAQALFVPATNTAVTHRSRLATLAASHRLPSISEFPLMAQAGFLLSYGADLDDLGRRAITYIDKILKGARPGDLAIERPTRFQLIVNLKTARTLGITIPQALLLRADEVIE